MQDGRRPILQGEETKSRFVLLRFAERVRQRVLTWTGRPSSWRLKMLSGTDRCGHEAMRRQRARVETTPLDVPVQRTCPCDDAAAAHVPTASASSAIRQRARARLGALSTALAIDQRSAINWERRSLYSGPIEALPIGVIPTRILRGAPWANEMSLALGSGRDSGSVGILLSGILKNPDIPSLSASSHASTSRTQMRNKKPRLGV